MFVFPLWYCIHCCEKAREYDEADTFDWSFHSYDYVEHDGRYYNQGQRDIDAANRINNAAIE